MKAKITVYLENGVVLEGTTDLLASSDANSKRRARVRTPAEAKASANGPDFSTPLRPFIKALGSGLSGPKKLTLLVSHLTRGKRDVPVSRSEVEKQWSKIQALMGGPYNGAYGIRARDQGWIDSPKRGSFTLRAGWEAILQ